MSSPIRSFIERQPLADTHEHLRSGPDCLAEGADLLEVLFGQYPGEDLVSAGATPEEMQALLDASRDPADRWRTVERYWPHCEWTGYGESVRWVLRKLYEIEDLTPKTVSEASVKHRAACKPGRREHLLRETAGLSEVQIDNILGEAWDRPPGEDTSFFRYDLSWFRMADGRFGKPEIERLEKSTAVPIHTFDDLDAAVSALFEKEAPSRVAIKSQHAYQRSLAWREVPRGDAARIFNQVLRGEQPATEDAHALGDWFIGRAAEEGARHGLPFKIHCGYFAGNGSIELPWISAGNLVPLLKKYTETKFILMHAAYPYCEEWIALGKHFRNVYLDFCWAWAINPRTTQSVFRSALRAVPINKILGFGGDALWPEMSAAYAAQARHGLAAALEAEIAAGDLSESRSFEIARRVMGENQADLMPRRHP